MDVKKIIETDRILRRIYYFIRNYVLGRNRYRIRQNVLTIEKAVLRRTHVLIHGKNNTVKIGDGAHLNKCTIVIYGDNSHIQIGADCICDAVSFYIEDAYSEIIIGAHTTVSSKTEIAAIEGKRIVIGHDCMLSSLVRICTGDSHSLLNTNGKRINPSQDIVLGNHIWVGTRAMINKGVSIAANCTIGAGSLMTKSVLEPFSVIAGVPARVIKTGVDWRRERL